jgi:hypothetical protein
LNGADIEFNIAIVAAIFVREQTKVFPDVVRHGIC